MTMFEENEGEDLMTKSVVDKRAQIYTEKLKRRHSNSTSLSKVKEEVRLLPGIEHLSFNEDPLTLKKLSHEVDLIASNGPFCATLLYTDDYENPKKGKTPGGILQLSHIDHMEDILMGRDANQIRSRKIFEVKIPMNDKEDTSISVASKTNLSRLTIMSTEPQIERATDDANLNLEEENRHQSKITYKYDICVTLQYKEKVWMAWFHFVKIQNKLEATVKEGEESNNNLSFVSRIHIEKEENGCSQEGHKLAQEEEEGFKLHSSGWIQLLDFPKTKEESIYNGCCTIDPSLNAIAIGINTKVYIYLLPSMLSPTKDDCAPESEESIPTREKHGSFDFKQDTKKIYNNQVLNCTMDANVYAILDGHIGMVTHIVFDLVHEGILLTLCANRVLKIWDLVNPVIERERDGEDVECHGHIEGLPKYKPVDEKVIPCHTSGIYAGSGSKLYQGKNVTNISDPSLTSSKIKTLTMNPFCGGNQIIVSTEDGNVIIYDILVYNTSLSSSASSKKGSQNTDGHILPMKTSLLSPPSGLENNKFFRRNTRFTIYSTKDDTQTRGETEKDRKDLERKSLSLRETILGIREKNSIILSQSMNIIEQSQSSLSTSSKKKKEIEDFEHNTCPIPLAASYLYPYIMIIITDEGLYYVNTKTLKCMKLDQKLVQNSGLVHSGVITFNFQEAMKKIGLISKDSFTNQMVYKYITLDKIKEFIGLPEFQAISPNFTSNKISIQQGNQIDSRSPAESEIKENYTGVDEKKIQILSFVPQGPFPENSILNTNIETKKEQKDPGGNFVKSYDNVCHEYFANKSNAIKSAKVPSTANNAFYNKQQGKAIAENKRNISKSKKNNSNNLPLVFHNRINSSGYGQQVPWSEQKKEKERRKRSEMQSTQKKNTRLSLDSPNKTTIDLGDSWNTGGKNKRRMPLDSGHSTAMMSASKGLMAENTFLPPTDLDKKEILPADLKLGPITCMTISPDGKFLSTASTTGSLDLLRLPLAKFKGTKGLAMAGHSATVRSINFSNDRTLVISSGDDNTVKVWSLEGERNVQDASITWSPSILENPSSSSSSSSKFKTTSSTHHLPSIKKIPPSSKLTSSPSKKSNICAAHFFSLDRFLLVGEGNRLNLLMYTRPATIGETTLIRRVGNGKVKTLAQWETFNKNCHYITAFGSINSIISSSVIICGSDKSISFLDVNTGQHIAHSDFINGYRSSIRCLALPSASPFYQKCYSTLPVESSDGRSSSHGAYEESINLDIFLTASDGLVYRWDLRQGLSPTAAYRGPMQNRTGLKDKVGLALSPCLQYGAVGSEDGRVYIYDLRMGKTLSIFKEHRDVVSALCFHPSNPSRLLSASYDGKINSYCSLSSSG